MTPEQYWEGDPYLARAFYKAHKLHIIQKNQELWLQGLYNYNALNTVVGNALKKKGAHSQKYLEKPIDLFPDDTAERKAIKERDKAVQFFESMRKKLKTKNGSND